MSASGRDKVRLKSAKRRAGRGLLIVVSASSAVLVKMASACSSQYPGGADSGCDERIRDAHCVASLAVNTRSGNLMQFRFNAHRLTVILGQKPTEISYRANGNAHGLHGHAASRRRKAAFIVGFSVPFAIFPPTVMVVGGWEFSGIGWTGGGLG
ncbi:hypothetical protein C8R43DRAFT_966216 [Mycena crocata]|nr:hypothetical protein C8R43DRAFT_966216 [Mycena crocata]